MSDTPKRRRSRSVDLAILGTAGGAMSMLGGCSQASFQRNIYRSFADCAADYTTAACSADGHQDAGTYLGPVYRIVNGRPSACRASDRGGGPVHTSRKIGTLPVSRGGFGTSCPSSSSSSGSGRRFWSGS